MRGMALFDDRPWDGETQDDLPEVQGVPTMLAQDERQLYAWLAEHWVTGAGAVVDLGAFLGGSTARLAAGVAAGAARSDIHCYDRFTAGAKLCRKYAIPPEGDGLTDILPHARTHLAPWSDRISFHRGEIERIGWDGGLIELLAIDAFKSVESTDAMVEAFFPHLIPGRSIILQQDYLHWAQPWIVALMDRLGDVFTPIAYARRDTVAFLCTGAVTEAHLDRARLSEIDDGDLRAAIARTRRGFSRWGFGHRLRKMADAVAERPNCRTAWAMTSYAEPPGAPACARISP